ncbi:MAG: ribonuclease P protein subunit [Candidatus Nitrosopolaris sp.]
MITPKNILSHELIGLHATVITSPQPTVVGLSGTIIFETKNMLTLRTSAGPKKISKLSAQKMRVRLPSSNCFIRGPSLIGRPEDRVLRTQGVE